MFEVSPVDALLSHAYTALWGPLLSNSSVENAFLLHSQFLHRNTLPSGYVNLLKVCLKVELKGKVVALCTQALGLIPGIVFLKVFKIIHEVLNYLDYFYLTNRNFHLLHSSSQSALNPLDFS